MVGHYNRPDPKLKPMLYRYFAKVGAFWATVAGAIYWLM